MKTGCLLDKQTGQVIIAKVLQTTNFFERGRGLLARKPLKKNEGMLIVPCNSIHTFFMTYALDIVFLDQQMEITSLRPDIKPWRFCSSYPSANVLELPAGSISRFSLSLTQQLQWKEHSE